MVGGEGVRGKGGREEIRKGEGWKGRNDREKMVDRNSRTCLFNREVKAY